MLFLGIFLSEYQNYFIIENQENHTEPPAEKDKNARTLFPYSLFRLWNLRILLYTLVFLWAMLFFYQQFVSVPLERMNQAGISLDPSVWSIFNEGVAGVYILCYLLLIILFLIEFTLCEFYSLYGAGDEKRITISKRIRMGIGGVAVVITCLLAFLWR